jgi:hypothetical protein
MEVTFDMVTQIPKLLKELLEIVQKPAEERRRQRIDFFQKEIVPIHEAMEAINDDYTTAFVELLELFNSKKNVPRAIELLKKKRLVLLASRTAVQAYAAELKEIKKRGYIKNREIAAFERFADGILSYLKNASPGDARFSWYSAFISEFEAMPRWGESPFEVSEFQTISGGNVVEKVRNAFHTAIHDDMPAAWKTYIGAYYNLRLELTR